jgi:hypothetical protein
MMPRRPLHVAKAFEAGWFSRTNAEQHAHTI